MITDIRLKDFLESLKRRQIQSELWEKRLLVEDDVILKEYEYLVLQIKVLRSALEILTDEKRFIIETHLIHHKSWSETERLYEEKWGAGNGRSERTLKRKQSNALREMVEFIKTSKMEKFFSDI